MSGLISIFDTIPHGISFATIAREDRPHGRVPATSFTRIFVENKMGRYTEKSKNVLNRFCQNLKEEIDMHIQVRRAEKGDPFLPAQEVREELATKLCVSEQALRAWSNPCDKSGNKMGIGDLIAYSEKIKSTFLIEALLNDLKEGCMHVGSC